MRKILRVLYIVIGLAVLLFAGAAVALVSFFDPNDFKSTLTEKVKEATGRELLITGDIELSLFPWFGVKTGALTLGNPPGFKQTSFAHVDAAEARAKLLPLFSGNVEMDTVSLKGLELNLIRLGNGRDNWSDLGAKKPAKTEGTEKSGSANALAALAIGGINVENATLIWDDQQAHERIELSELSLKTGELSLGAPMSFALRSNIKRQSDGLNGLVKATTTLRMNPFEGSYAADDLNLSLALKGKNLPGQQLDAALRANLAADLIKQTLSLTNLEVSALSLQANGKLHASNILKTPTYKGELTIKQFNPRTLMALIGNKLDLADPKALSSAQFNIDFTGNDKHIKLGKLDGKLDDTTLKGSLSVLDFSNTAITFDLALDKIDLDRYRGTAPTGQGTKAATPATAAAASAPVLPVKLLRTLNVSGNARINTLRVAQLDVTDIRMTANAKNGDIKLQPLSAKLSGGTYDGDIQINVKGPEPAISLHEKLLNVQAGPLVKTFSGYDAMQGTGNIVANMTTRGNTDDALRRNLNGNLSFNIGDGLLKGINIDHQLRSAYATIKGKPKPSDQGIKDTVFSALKANAIVTNGVLANRDLAVNTDNLRISGEGEVNLVNESIRYRLATNIIKSLDGPNSKEFDELKRLTIPVIVQGPLSNPAINVDLERLLTQKVQQKLEDKLKNSLFGKPKKEAAPAAPATQPQPAATTQPAPAATPETAEERAKRKKEEKRRKKEALFKKIFN